MGLVSHSSFQASAGPAFPHDLGGVQRPQNGTLSRNNHRHHPSRKKQPENIRAHVSFFGDRPKMVVFLLASPQNHKQQVPTKEDELPSAGPKASNLGEAGFVTGSRDLSNPIPRPGPRLHAQGSFRVSAFAPGGSERFASALLVFPNWWFALWFSFEATKKGELSKEDIPILFVCFSCVSSFP